MSTLFPDSGWLKLLTFPARVSAGLFLFSILALAFNYLGLIELAAERQWLILTALLFGCLFAAAVGGLIYDHVMQTRKKSLLRSRRELQKAEELKARHAYEAGVIQRIDYLSKEELSYVADCLRANEQSFLTYIYSPPVSNLGAKGFVGTPGGSHNQDHYPFYFHDFAWRALLARKDELIAKDDANIRAAAEAERASRRR